LVGRSHDESVTAANAHNTHGQDDSDALAFAGFVIGMDKYDRGASFAAFDAALALTHSSVLTYMLGSVIYAWAREAERAVEWTERGLRLSPYDPTDPPPTWRLH
jgi:hypothetical protein